MIDLGRQVAATTDLVQINFQSPSHDGFGLALLSQSDVQKKTPQHLRDASAKTVIDNKSS